MYLFRVRSGVGGGTDDAEEVISLLRAAVGLAPEDPFPRFNVGVMVQRYLLADTGNDAANGTQQSLLSSFLLPPR